MIVYVLEYWVDLPAQLAAQESQPLAASPTGFVLGSGSDLVTGLELNDFAGRLLLLVV